MINVRMDSNIDRIKLKFDNLVGGIEEKATVRALNRAGDQAVTAASREIRRVYNLSAKFARSQIKVRDRARKGSLFFTIRIFSKRIPLVEFVKGSKAITVTRKRPGKGVTVEIKKGQSKLIPHSFIARMKSGHLGVVARIVGKQRADAPFRFGKGSGKSGRRWGDPDIPIGELTTLSVPRMFLEKTVRSAVTRVAIDSFQRNFEQQIKFLSSQAS
jgi:hypothetical protein